MTKVFPISLPDETAKAWLGSILFHLVVVLILYLAHINESRRITGFVEVTLGSLATGQSVMSSEVTRDDRSEVSAKSSAPVIVKQAKSMKLDLPERKYPVDDEVLRLPPTKKLEVTDLPERKAAIAHEQRLVGEKDLGAGKSPEVEKLTGEGKRGTIGDGAGMSGSSIGTDIGRTIGYSVQWAGGGTRQKISGDLPIYPEGVNLEAQIRLQAVVAPDGTVKSVYPIQKAQVKLEEAGMKEVRFWKFEPLSVTQPQIDQNCTVTFNFKLK